MLKVNFNSIHRIRKPDIPTIFILRKSLKQFFFHCQVQVGAFPNKYFKLYVGKKNMNCFLLH